MAEFEFENHGSIYMIRPTTAEACDHAEEAFDTDAPRLGNAIACEPRFAATVAQGLLAEGFTVALDGREIEAIEEA